MDGTVVVSPAMCICVDCHWVDRCSTYHAVETQHGVRHLTANPDFQPRRPRINVHLRSQGLTTTVEWDVVTCNSFLTDLGHWQRLRPREAVPT